MSSDSKILSRVRRWEAILITAAKEATIIRKQLEGENSPAARKGKRDMSQVAAKRRTSVMRSVNKKAA